MGEVALEVMQKTGQISRKVLEAIEKLLQALLLAQDTKKKHLLDKSFAESFGAEVKSYFYSIADTHIAEEFERKCFDANIPMVKGAREGEYVCYATSKMIQTMRNIEYDALSKIGYYQEAPLQALDNIQVDAVKLEGLNEFEFETLKNKLNSISPRSTIYDEELNNGKTFNVAFRADKDIKNGAKALLETAVSLYGQNQSIKVQQLEYDKKIDTKVYGAVKASIDSEDIAPIYITNYVNKDRDGNFKKPKYCLEINSEGAIIYEVCATNNNRDSDITPVSSGDLQYTAYTKTDKYEKMSCKADEANYQAFIQKWLDKMEDKEMFTTLRDVLDDASLDAKALANAHQDRENTNNARPTKNDDAKQYSRAAKCFIDTLDKYLNTKDDAVMKAAMVPRGDANPDYVNIYINHAERIIQCLSNKGSRDINEVLQGTDITATDVENIKKEASKNFFQYYKEYTLTSQDKNRCEKDVEFEKNKFFESYRVFNKLFDRTSDIQQSLEKFQNAGVRSKQKLTENAKDDFYKEVDKRTIIRPSFNDAR